MGVPCGYMALWYGYVYSQPMLEWEGQHVLGRLARLETEPWVAEISKFIFIFIGFT